MSQANGMFSRPAMQCSIASLPPICWRRALAALRRNFFASGLSLRRVPTVPDWLLTLGGRGRVSVSVFMGAPVYHRFGGNGTMRGGRQVGSKGHETGAGGCVALRHRQVVGEPAGGARARRIAGG